MKEHVNDLLSPFIDGQLPEAERRMVETHVEGCEACGRELADLRGVSKLLAGAPRRPLPTGFVQRLERRRQAQTAAEAERPRHLLPMPARALAYSMSAAVVCLVAYDAINGSKRLDLAATTALTDSSTTRWADRRARRASPQQMAARDNAFGSSSDSAAPASADEGAAFPKKDARAAGAPIGVADLLSPPAEPQAPAPERVAAGGRSNKEISNEKLQRHLEAERRKLGIQEIVPRGQVSRPADDLPPMSQADAREYMRGMTESLVRQRMGMENYSEPVPLGGGKKPQLLKEEAEAKSIGATIGERNEPILNARNAPSKPATHMLAAADLEASARVAQAPVYSLPYVSPGSVTQEQEKQESDGARPKAKVGAIARGAGAGSGGSGGGLGGTFGAGSSRMMSKLAAPASAPKPAAPPGPPAASAARSVAEMEKMWKILGKSGELPAVDFSDEMVVAVSAASPIEIVGVRTLRDRIVLECRYLPAGGSSSGFRVLPRSNFPVVIEIKP